MAVFIVFLNCRNSIKSGKASQLPAEPKRLVDCGYTSSSCKMLLEKSVLSETLLRFQETVKFHEYFANWPCQFKNCKIGVHATNVDQWLQQRPDSRCQLNITVIDVTRMLF